MSNTAVQRRALDIEKAGGNRALAFVNGSEASTPTISPARVEPTRFNSPNFGSALLMRQQADLLKSQAAKNSADTASTVLDTQIRAASADLEVEDRGLSHAASAQKADREIKNYMLAQRKVEAELQDLVSRAEARAISAYIAKHTREDVIAAVQSGAIIRGLQIDTEGIKSDWARIKRTILGILDTE